MTVEKIRDLTAQAVCQVIGDTYYSTDDNTISTTDYIKALDDAKLVDVGKTVDNFQNGKEQFTKALIDVISKMYIESREYVEELPDIFIDRALFGAFAESVQFDLHKVIDDPTWDLVDGTSYASAEHTFYQPKVSVKIFGERKAVAIPYSIGSKQLRSSFQNFSEMAVFISGIESWVQNTIKIIYEAYGKMLLSLAAGLSISTDTGALNNAVHLLTEYNTKFSKSLSADAALDDEDFLIYAAKRIKKIRRMLSRMGTQYNDGSVNTFTPERDKRLVLLGDFVDSMKFNVRANTYNPEDVALGDFTELSTWQGVRGYWSASAYSFSITTKMKSGDKIKIGDVTYTAGTDIDLTTDTTAGNAAAIIALLNASSDASVSGFTWTVSGAKITGTTDSGHYAEKFTVSVTKTTGGTVAISSISTDTNGMTVNEFKDLSTIAIKADNSKLPFQSDLVKHYVIGLMYDYRGIGMTYNDTFVTTSYTGVSDFANYFNHLLVNYIVNTGYNMVAFVVD